MLQELLDGAANKAGFTIGEAIIQILITTFAMVHSTTLVSSRQCCLI